MLNVGIFFARERSTAFLCHIAFLQICQNCLKHTLNSKAASDFRAAFWQATAFNTTALCFAQRLPKHKKHGRGAWWRQLKASDVFAHLVLVYSDSEFSAWLFEWNWAVLSLDVSSGLPPCRLPVTRKDAKDQGNGSEHTVHIRTHLYTSVECTTYSRHAEFAFGAGAQHVCLHGQACKSILSLQ